MTPHTCPVCNGAGRVSRPPWVAGDVTEWSSSSAGPYPCQSCNGTGIVWETETTDSAIYRYFTEDIAGNRHYF